MKVPSSSSSRCTNRVTPKEGCLRTDSGRRRRSACHAMPCHDAYTIIMDSSQSSAEPGAPEFFAAARCTMNACIMRLFDERGARLSLVASRYSTVGLLYYTYSTVVQLRCNTESHHITSHHTTLAHASLVQHVQTHTCTCSCVYANDDDSDQRRRSLNRSLLPSRGGTRPANIRGIPRTLKGPPTPYST